MFPMIPPAPIDSPAALTRFIELHYHERHREELRDLAAMATRVEQRHAGHNGVPDGLSVLLQRMIGTMEVHMKKEELILFPAIRRGGMPGIETPIAVMRADHDEHAEDIAEIRRLTNDLRPPVGACRTWSALYAGLSGFLDALKDHIDLENDILFPPFEQAARHA